VCVCVCARVCVCACVCADEALAAMRFRTESVQIVMSLSRYGTALTKQKAASVAKRLQEMDGILCYYYY